MKKEIISGISVFSVLIVSLLLTGFLAAALPAPPASPTMGTNSAVNASTPDVRYSVNSSSNQVVSSGKNSTSSILGPSVLGFIIFIVIVIFAYVFFMKFSKK